MRKRNSRIKPNPPKNQEEVVVQRMPDNSVMLWMLTRGLIILITEERMNDIALVLNGLPPEGENVALHPHPAEDLKDKCKALIIGNAALELTNEQFAKVKNQFNQLILH
ncbi:hypothetical protein [Paraburkholderia elongata]|uniref:Uncharacterized protein n=1 Tax=Paraburkholderia elongata TaxID=2675747 RepID=A0A972NJS7_9BURK|nr:hypothetical protein [Paraburkholderia elongata]NPT53573.1 hypothetical protein [Paraburkholderia elongata]